MPKLSAEVIQEKRERILAAAGHVFAEKGYDRTTVKDLEEATGMTRGGIFAHFDNKMAVFRAALDQHLDEGLMPTLRGTVSEGSSAEEALLAAYRAIVAWHADHPDAMRLTEQSRVLESTEPELSGNNEQSTARMRETIVRNVQDRQARGVYRSDVDPWAASEVIHVIMDQLIADAVTQPRHQAEANARRIFTVLAKGLQAEPQPALDPE